MRQLQPLSLGKILDETFDIYRHHWLLFIGISAGPNIVLLIFKAFAGSTVISMETADAAGLLTLFATLIVAWFVSSVVTAATTLGVSDIYLDRPTSIKSCFSRVAGKALKVGWVSFLVSLIVGLGFLLLVVPGIYWAGVYGIAIPAVVLENISASESMERSKHLTKNAVGRVIIVSFLTGIFAWAMSTAAGAGLNALSPAVFAHSGVLTKEVLAQILTTLAEIVLGPISAIGLTLVYYDQRVRKEAFDLEHMMRMMTAQAASSGSSA